MNRLIDKYLNQVMLYADPDHHQAPHIRAELEDHLQTKTCELEQQGVSHTEAVLAAIEDLGHPRIVGYGLRKHRWLDIRTHGTARGFIAIGPKAVGTFAIGGIAFGLFACGVVGVGVVSLSAIGAGLIFCFGAALAFAPLGFAYGSIAIGLAAAGFWSCGLVCLGYECLGLVKVERDFFHQPYAHGPFFLVYLLATMRLYIGIWPSLATAFVAHTLFWVCLTAAGLGAFVHRLSYERSRIGYTVPRAWVCD